jgi:Protein of unknown function (DUF1416)
MGCGGVVGGAGLEQVDVSKEAIIEGVVVRGDEPVSPAYVRLLDRTGEFTAEVPTDERGQFRFFAAPGEWTLRALTPRAAPADATVTASRGTIADVRITVS